MNMALAVVAPLRIKKLNRVKNGEGITFKSYFPRHPIFGCVSELMSLKRRNWQTLKAKALSRQEICFSDS